MNDGVLEYPFLKGVRLLGPSGFELMNRLFKLAQPTFDSTYVCFPSVLASFEFRFLELAFSDKLIKL